MNKYNFNIEQGDIFKKIGIAKAICVTTNGIVKQNGQLVMGAGIAKQFSNLFPQAPHILGNKVTKHGNHVYHIADTNGTSLMSFPTKQDYRDKSDLQLIIESAKRLVKWANINNIVEPSSIYIPSPGTGLGGLNKSQVYNTLNGLLDNRFVIITK